MDLCVDCNAPALRDLRCEDCIEEINETPDWSQLAAGETRCRYCEKAFHSNHRTAKYCSRSCSARANGPTRSAYYASLRPATCREDGCTNPCKGRKPWCGPCERKRYPEDPDKVRARMRRKTYWRKAKTRRSDFSAEAERHMRAKTKRCPLCDVRMVAEPYLPASKELDHMVPLNVGGTHTIGNVRIICRTCNIKRPKDGSDYTGPVTLFALEVA